MNIKCYSLYMLRIYNNDQLIFSSEKKWLHPLFEFEEFLKTYNGPVDNLRSHDSAIGKAAAVLSLRLGIKNIHADLLSKLGQDYINQVLGPGHITCDTLIDRLMCQTENQLEKLTDSDEMYYLLRKRAKMVLGVSVKVENLSYKYGKINNLNFEITPGSRLMIQGENGAGKTTLLRLISGIYKPDAGKITIDDLTIAELPEFTIGYIPQLTEAVEQEMFDLNVQEVVGLGIKAGSRLQREKEISDAMKRTGCSHLAGKSFSVLSGGEKQKVSLARCLAQKAKLLLLDEPTANMDKENRKMVIDILHSLSISEIPTIIMVTHDDELKELKGWETINLE